MKGIRHASRGVGTLLCATLLASAGMQGARAEEIHIKMLDRSGSGPLAFEPGFVKANPGDVLVFEPAQKGGHSTVSLLVPPGAQAWSGVADRETRAPLDAEGVYLYACAAHKMMGMVGVVQVGKAVNLEQAKSVAAKESARFVLNKDRFDKELAQIE
ncbi:MAG: pseudoazurin [Rhodocyclaceae bacterium]|nr:pseudoazurin [Rhodocyclaceae bacterium]